MAKLYSIFIFFFVLKFFFKFYLFERESRDSDRDSTREYERGGEGEAGSSLKEPNVGLDPRTLGL